MLIVGPQNWNCHQISVHIDLDRFVCREKLFCFLVIGAWAWILNAIVFFFKLCVLFTLLSGKHQSGQIPLFCAYAPHEREFRCFLWCDLCIHLSRFRLNFIENRTANKTSKRTQIPTVFREKIFGSAKQERKNRKFLLTILECTGYTRIRWFTLDGFVKWYNEKFIRLIFQESSYGACGCATAI